MDIEVILGIFGGYGAEQILIAAAVSLIAMLVKRKFRLNLRRELAVRLICSLALAALVAFIFGKNYAQIIGSASASLGLSYVLSNLFGKNKSPTAETFLRSVAPYLSDEEVKSVINGDMSEDGLRETLKTLLKQGTPEEEIIFLTDVIIALKKFE